MAEKEMVYRLTKSLYGLKQAPRKWYKKSNGFMQQNGLFRCNADHYCYFKKVKLSFIILLLYVDDMLVAGANLEEINDLKKQFSSEFKMKDLEYVCKVFQRFNMSDTKPVRISLASHFRLSNEQCPKTNEEKDLMVKVPYASATGSLMQATLGSSEMDPEVPVGYIKLSEKCLTFRREELKLEDYVDSDFAGEVDNKKSTTEYVFTVGSIAIS
ncbi:hypothetical protein Q3G72_007410 [Acer saccharum]|nr:hypothetical protein Q3G72_007410 [Acer saccharum]